MVFEYDLEGDSRRLDEDDDDVGRVTVGDNGRRPRKYATLQVAIPKAAEDGIMFTSCSSGGGVEPPEGGRVGNSRGRNHQTARRSGRRHHQQQAIQYI